MSIHYEFGNRRTALEQIPVPRFKETEASVEFEDVYAVGFDLLRVRLFQMVVRPLRAYYDLDDQLVFGPGEPQKTNMAIIQLSQLAGCCGVCVWERLSVGITYRNQRLLGTYYQYLLLLTKALGYSAIVATDRVFVEQTTRFLLNRGWTRATLFNNQRTHNDVGIWTLSLKDAIYSVPPAGGIIENNGV